MLLVGIAVTLTFWSRLAKRDSRLMMIYGAALVNAFVGAKVVYLLAEGWLFWDSPDRWLIWATGKSVSGDGNVNARISTYRAGGEAGRCGWIRQRILQGAAASRAVFGTLSD